jgi:hypothetical protein
LVGLERPAATETLSQFLAAATYSGAQFHSVSPINTHLTENGPMEAARFHEPVHQRNTTETGRCSGPRTQTNIITILRSVRANEEATSNCHLAARKSPSRGGVVLGTAGLAEHSVG